ncbi:MAG: hypothetical protein ABEJ34_06295 [Haloferacaceae archaeon]
MEHDSESSVPAALRSRDTDEPCEFGVPVEVVRGYGSTVHLYPQTTVSSPTDLLRSPDGEPCDPDATLAADVTWYTRPREEL